MTQLRISRRGVEDVFVDVDPSNALVLHYLPIRQAAEPFAVTSEMAFSLNELERVEVLDPPEAIVVDRPHRWGYYVDDGERVPGSPYPEVDPALRAPAKTSARAKT